MLNRDISEVFESLKLVVILLFVELSFEREYVILIRVRNFEDVWFGEYFIKIWLVNFWYFYSC